MNDLPYHISELRGILDRSNYTVVDRLVAAVSCALHARAMSRSVSGLFMILSRVNLFNAETGGQLRMTTISSLRSSESRGSNVIEIANKLLRLTVLFVVN